MKEKIVKKNGIRLFTESFGCEKDPAILLIAGATVSMLYWDAEFCQKLSERGFFVIRYDNRDVGKSTNYEPGSTPYDIVDLTHDAISILDGYKIVKANFVGISLGGLISQIASIKYADRVSSITLISSGPWGDSDPTIPEMDTRILDFWVHSGRWHSGHRMPHGCVRCVRGWGFSLAWPHSRPGPMRTCDASLNPAAWPARSPRPSTRP